MAFLREHFSFLWSKLQQKILKLDLVGGPGTLSPGIVSLLNNLGCANKALFLLGGLLLPIQKQMCIMIRKFVSVAVYKIYQLRLAKLRGRRPPGLPDKACNLCVKLLSFVHYIRLVSVTLCFSPLLFQTKTLANSVNVN